MPGWYRIPGTALLGEELLEALLDKDVTVEWPEGEHRWTFIYHRHFDGEVIDRVNKRDFSAIPEWVCEHCGLPWDGQLPRRPRRCHALEVEPAAAVMEWLQRFVSVRREERNLARVEAIARQVIEEAYVQGGLDELDRSACYGIIEAGDTLGELWKMGKR